MAVVQTHLITRECDERRAPELARMVFSVLDQQIERYVHCLGHLEVPILRPSLSLTVQALDRDNIDAEMSFYYVEIIGSGEDGRRVTAKTVRNESFCEQFIPRLNLMPLLALFTTQDVCEYSLASEFGLRHEFCLAGRMMGRPCMLCLRWHSRTVKEKQP